MSEALEALGWIERHFEKQAIDDFDPYFDAIRAALEQTSTAEKWPKEELPDGTIVDVHPDDMVARPVAEAQARELEEALRAFVDNSSIQANHPHECEQAEKLLEKGNE